MLRIVIDQDFDYDILRGIVRRLPELDFMTAREAGLGGVQDQELLIWAAANDRILVTHDRKTMPRHFVTLLEQGKNLAGVVVVPRQLPIGLVIDELEILIACSEQGEWRNFIHILTR